MKIRTSAPGRCGMVGNPSDIYGGFVVSCSVPLRAHCTLELGGSGALPDDTRIWDAVMARFPLGGTSVEWTTDIPKSRGISGSTALLAATLLAVLIARADDPASVFSMLGESPGRRGRSSDEGGTRVWLGPGGPETGPLSELWRTSFAELVRDVELNDAGIICGYQDALMISHGGLRWMDFAGKHPIDSGPPPTTEEISCGISADDGGLPFLLISTDVERLSGGVHGPMRERWLNGDQQVVQAMDRIAELGRLGRTFLESGDLYSLGQAMTENHALVAELGGSGAEIDHLIAECLANGATSAKLAGAGLGGTVIALTQDPVTLTKALSGCGYRLFERPAPTFGVSIDS
ncbi:MAG: hypothetical protein JST40_02155 [Armatimonadetes bacterium]|nr:hypothetical protein [Armatimonadota bacterium]